MIVNWVCFVKLLRIDRTVPVYTDVDVHRGRYRDPLTSPHRLNKGSTIDLSTTDPAAEEAASTMVRNAMIFAKAQTLSFFDEDVRAVEILKPMLRGEINQSQGP